MRRGIHPSMVYNDSGLFIGIATGSDSVSEHEQGAEPLLQSLTKFESTKATAIKSLRREFLMLNSKNPLMKLAGNLKVRFFPYTIPSVVESKRVTKLPKTLQFIKIEGDVPEAYLGVARNPLTNYERELRFPSTSTGADANCAGAWNEKSFAFRVRGADYVNKLTQLYEAFRNNGTVFSGSFTAQSAGGVVLCISELFDQKIIDQLAIGQAKFVADMRLKALDESSHIEQALRKFFDGTFPGFIRPTWIDEAKSTFAYLYNPNRGFDAEYQGPYSKEELLTWGACKGTYRLKPGMYKNVN